MVKNIRGKMKAEKEILRIGKLLISKDVNGPGKRFVIWVQGCPFRCKGCFNSEFWSEDDGIFMDLRELIFRITTIDDIEGVTFTGGEPFLQVESLITLARVIKAKGLSIFCYTGYLLQELLEDKISYARELLKLIDILVDGPYRDKERASLLWRGSRNQNIYFLTDLYKDLEPLITKEGIRTSELKSGEDGLAITGFFDMEVWKILKEKITK